VKLLAAVLCPNEGEIQTEGILVQEENQWEIREQVAVVFQRPDDQFVLNRVADDMGCSACYGGSRTTATSPSSCALRP
jgi:energy-coupling factor transporter ATP-binding protein EcfA2